MSAPPKRKPGRPRSPLPERTMVRSTKAQKIEWKRLAKVADRSLNSWMLRALDAAVGRAPEVDS